jgi:hypothetical protein
MGPMWAIVRYRDRRILRDKDMLESVGDTFALLDKLHIY